jgi:predicted RNA methylase
MIPAYRSSADSWKGVWLGDLTAGPGALGTAAVTGGAGSLRGLKMEAVESLSARAYSVENGPVAAEGQLLIELPRNMEGSDVASSSE